jgi:putative PIN family toxin of toxin-antitoxin system
MIVLLDTNILVSAALRDRLPERVLLYVATRDECQWLVTPAILEEYREVLARPKFELSADAKLKWIALAESRSLLLEADLPPNVDFPRDPKDQPFLVAALVAGADHLVTGDTDLLAAQHHVSTQIVTVAEFARIFDIS